MTAIAITAGSVVATSGATRDAGIAAEAITAGQAIYVNTTTNRVMLADTNSATAEARLAKGIALNGASAEQPVTYIKEGDLTVNAVLTKGISYYLGGAGGAIVPVADLTTGDYTCILGIAKSTTVLAVKIQSAGVAI